MRIAYYAPLNAPLAGPPSGDRYVAGATLQALRLGGHQVELVSTFRSLDAMGDSERQRGLGMRGLAIADELAARWDAANVAQRPQLWFTYHLYYKAPDWLGPRLSRRLGIPYVIAEASHAEKRANGPWSFGHAACADAIRAADLLLCPSRDDIAALGTLTQAPIVHFAPFLEVEALQKAATERDRHRAHLASRHELDAACPWILAVGMMRPGDKLASYRALAAALSRLTALPWRLLVAGDGASRPEVEASIAQATPGRAVFLGALDRTALAGVYAACDLLAWPAVNEAYGMALLEAQCAGLPVVAADTRGVPDVVQDGHTGVLVCLGDDAAFALAVKGLLLDPDRRRALGRAAAAYVGSERSLEVAAARLEHWLARFDPASG
jgi:glycosyltransferase involved in cell wall biosynthesis